MEPGYLSIQTLGEAGDRAGADRLAEERGEQGADPPGTRSGQEAVPQQAAHGGPPSLVAHQGLGAEASAPGAGRPCSSPTSVVRSRV